VFIVAVFGGQATLAQGTRPAVVTAAAAGLPPHTAPAVETAAAVESSPLRLAVGRSTLVNVGVPITRVSLTSADVADALVTSSNQLLVHGKEPGSISMFVWEQSGSVRRYEIVVERDLAQLREQMTQLFPGEQIQVHSSGSQIVLSGNVSGDGVAEQAVNVAAGFVDDAGSVVTLLQAAPPGAPSQVLLRVRFAEVSRSAMTEFGLSYFTSPTGIENTIGRLTTQQYAAPNFEDLAWTKADSDWGSDVTSAEGKINFSDFLNLFLFNQKYDLGVMVRALQSRGLFESLAEPNLIAESGKEASFLAGGEFPIPVVQGSSSNAAVSVQFKEFGVRLRFTPTVIADRVHLKVAPEVSTLDYANGVSLNGFQIPALSTRRTETEIELRDGQTFAIAGLMNNQMQQTMQKVPFIGDIPILGHLFRSRAAQKNQTELVVMITPEILRPDSPGVTEDLPRLPEPFLDPIPTNRTLPAPPAAFDPDGVAEAQAREAARLEAEARAIEEARLVAQRAREEQRARAEQVKLEEEARKQAERDARAAEKARQEQAKRDDEARQEAEKLAKEQAERDAKAAEQDRKAQAELEAVQAPDQARLEREAAERERREAEQAEREQATREAADARLRAAEAEFQAEVARRAEQ
jgi:pilus assembly protein CpaC